MAKQVEPLMISRRTYLTLKAMETDCGIFVAMEAVSTTLLEHPEWNPDTMDTWQGWESRRG